MKDPTPRDLALMVLNGLPGKNIFSDRYLNEVFYRNPHLDHRDRAFINQLVQGVLRWRLRLDWFVEQTSHFPLKKISPLVLNILRLALYQILFLDRVPESAAVNEAVKQAKKNTPGHVASFINGILRNICREKDRISFPDRQKELVRYLSVFYAYPDWLVKKWLKELGEKSTEALLSACNKTPLMALRTNLLKIDRPALLNRLSDEDVRGMPTPYAPEGIWLEGVKGRVSNLSSFRSGLFQVQNEAAQIMSHLLSPQPGETLLDLCAGFGGKSSHLAQLMGDRGRVLALDTNHRKLISHVENSRRLGFVSTAAIVGDATKSLSSLLRSRFEKVLVDAPCSGLGALSRHPDGKWNRHQDDLIRLAGLQASILSQAASVLRDGGKLLYVTCTISKEENEGVVHRFLEKHGDITLENIKNQIPEWGQGLVNDQGFLKTYPHIHNMDGFFAALFIKK